MNNNNTINDKNKLILKHNLNHERTSDDMIDVRIDNYEVDTNLENEIDMDDLETIRFESIPETKQKQPIPTNECSIFNWLFMCFT